VVEGDDVECELLGARTELTTESPLYADARCVKTEKTIVK